MTRGPALVLGSVALVLAVSGLALAATPSVAFYVLPSGLRLIVRHDPNAEVVAISLHVKSGARYETPETSGISHFLQRAMLRGTTRRSAQQIVEAAEDIGGTLDGSGDVDYADIRGAALAAHGEALLELIADVALSPALSVDEVERERRLILGQIRTRADSPFGLALDTLNARLYGAHPLGLPILGRKASVERIGAEELRRHYRRVYRAGSMVLAVSGRAERESIRRRVQQLFAGVATGEVERPVTAEPPPPAERTVLDRAAQQGQILMGFLGPGIGDPDYAPGKVMSAILGGGVGGRLFARLRENEGLAYSLGMLNPVRPGPGALVAYVGTAKDNLDRAEGALHDEIERFRADGPSEPEVARAKAYVLGSLAMDRRTNARHAWYLAFFELAGLGFHYPEHYARALEAVSRGDVSRVARRYLDRATTVVVRPGP
jgi:predicted Zn-dependent peptidase